MIHCFDDLLKSFSSFRSDTGFSLKPVSTDHGWRWGIRHQKGKEKQDIKDSLRKQWVHWPLCRVIIDDMDILSLLAMGYPVAVILGCQGMKKSPPHNPPKQPRLFGTRQNLCLALMGQMFTGQISQYISVILLEKSDFCQGSKCTNRP